MVFKQYIQLFIFLYLFFSFCSFAQTAKNEFVVVVDAGHGGKDPGNRGNGYFEKNIALNIALNVGEILTKNKVKVIYTRTKDVFVDCIGEHKLLTTQMLIYLFQYIAMLITLMHMVQELLFWDYTLMKGTLKLHKKKIL